MTAIAEVVIFSAIELYLTSTHKPNEGTETAATCSKLQSVIGNAMNNHKGLTIWTLIANFFIIIAAGHGIGTIGLLQLVTVADVLGLNNFFPPEQLFHHPLFWVVAVTFLGQLVMLATLLKNQRLVYIRLIGVVLLLIAFIILTYYLRNQETLQVTVVTGVPFLILSALLMYKHIYKRKVVHEA